MTRIPVLLTALALLFPATAAAKTCPTKSAYELTKVTNVTCAKAKQVLHRFFAGTTSPFGFTCKQKRYPGGVTTKCTKGDRRIVRQSAD